jgi:taurine dioxygenase
MPLEIEDLTPTIGSVIGDIDLADGDALEQHRAALRQALLDRQVIFFRDQNLSPAAQVRLAAIFGDVQPLSSTFPSHPDNPCLEVLESKGRRTGTDVWHADLTWQSSPPIAACLFAVEVPRTGGDTLWASMTAAHDAIDPQLRAYLAGLRAVHNWETPEILDSLRSKPDAAGQYARMRDAYPPLAHPVIVAHPETGRQILYVNEFYTTELVGLTRSESDALLRYLTSLARVPEWQVRFRWEPGSVAIWDNRSTQHYAVNDYHPTRRLMHRVGIQTHAALDREAGDGRRFGLGV